MNEFGLPVVPQDVPQPPEDRPVDHLPASSWLAAPDRTQRALVIIPTYNERENLPLLIPAVLATDPAIDVLIIDDGSPDGSGQLASAFAESSDRVRVIHRSGKQGLGTAYVRGFQTAAELGYGWAAQMDADFSHRPEDLGRLLVAARTADVVVGSRAVPGGRVEGWSPLRHLISRGGSSYARFVLGVPVKDCTAGFRVLSRRALDRIDLAALRSNGFAFQVELTHWLHQAGLSIIEVPILFPDRRAGASKMSSRIAIEAALLVLKLRLGRVPSALRTANTGAQQAAGRSA